MITTEVVPPRGTDAAGLRRTARRYSGLVTAANVTDNPGASVHLSPLAAAIILQQEGLEPILQLTCRDRNRLALQSDLLGAAAFDVVNLLCLRGDPPERGPQPDAKGVFDLDSVGFLKMVSRMRDHAELLAGEKLRATAPFFPGAAEIPTDRDLDNAMSRLNAKVDAGARFIQTQLVFDVPVFARWMAAVRDRHLHERVAILAGVGILRKVETARFLQTKVPGVVMPDETVSRFEHASPADGERIGRDLALSTVDQLRQLPGLAGVHLMAFNWADGVELVARELLGKQ